MHKTDEQKKRLWQSAADGDIRAIRAALDEDASWLEVWNQWGDNSEVTLLHVAAECDHAELVQVILTAGGDPTVFGPPKRPNVTPLHRSGVRGASAMRVLLDAGVPPNIKAPRGVVPLYTAAFHGNVEGCRLLLEHGAHPDGAGSGIPLFPAAQNGHVAIIDILVEAGAKLTKKNGKKETPLHWAARLGEVEASRRLVALGLDPDQMDKKDDSPRTHANFRGGDIKAFFETLDG